jgi:hypothetical protein
MTLTELDRTIFEHIRRSLVTEGYLPDVTTFQNIDDYVAAKQAIVDSGLEVIELFGHGASDSRGKFGGNRITINRTGSETGATGGSPSEEFKRTGTGVGSTFTKIKYQDATKDISYEVRVIATSTLYERIAQDIIDYAFGERRYVLTVDEEGEFTADHVLLLNNGTVNLKSTEDYQEMMTKYEIKDVWVGRENITKTNIKALSSITFSLYLGREENSTEAIQIITVPEQND